MEEKIRHAYRLCPCASTDVEGIQFWLEELAQNGLILETDGQFLGFFTFRKALPRRIRYRLIPVQEKKGFWNDSDSPDEEEKEFCAQWGWEYVVRYGSFYIYRTENPAAQPLHTDPAVQALALDALRKKQRNLLISQLLYWITLILLRSNGQQGLLLTGASTGIVHLLGLLGTGIWLIATMLLKLFRLRQYRKRVLLGDTLDEKKDWRKQAPVVFAGKLLPFLLILALIVPLLIQINHVSNRIPLEKYTGKGNYATLADVFPDAKLDHSNTMGDYNTVVEYSNALSHNLEWNETSDILTADFSGYCILRLKYFETASDFWAEGVARDIYGREQARYHGKRFEDIPAPETGFDSVRVFDSYGTLHILIRQDHRVYHAVVLISDRTQENHWLLWLRAMEDKLL